MDGSIDDNTSLCDSNSGTPKSKSALSRHRLKMEDPESYRRYLDKQKTRAKQRREELKRELQKKKGNEQAIAKKAHQNELQRLRQKRYMEKKKKEGINIKSSTPSSKAKPQTRNFIETIREYNRQKKRKEREKMSWQKKMWARKKDRERKQEKRKEAAKLKVLISSPSSTVQSTVGSPFGSKKTEYNITSKVRKSLPKSPAKFAKVFNNLLSTASPRKKEAMKKLKKLNLTPRFQLARQALAVKQASRSSKSSVIVAEHLSKRYRRGQIAGRKGSLKKRKSHVDRNSIQNFFFREDISRVLPGKRYATKEGPGYALQVSLKAAHVKYLAENPAKRVSLGKFAALRPRNVRLLRVSDREFCCCVYCINVRYKMLCLSQALADKDKKKTCEMDILDIVLCPKRNGQRYHEPDCINGKCSDCRDYMATMNVYYESIPEDKNLTWTRWGYRDSGKGKHKREVVTKRGNKHECLDEFLENDLKRPVQGTSFFQHVTTAQWQSSQFRQIKDKLPTGEVLQVMDFAKNREVKYQDEIKGAFYTAGQITMHPIITYYKSENGLVRNASIVISEDNDHDHFAVQHFQKIASPEIEKKLGASVKRKVIFSDGCSSQYKSKGPFAELAGSSDVVNRNYFGSEHGKSECDAEMGLVNRCVDRAIVANQVVINNAQDLYQYCKTNLESDSPFSKRTFHLVKLGEIDRKRPAIMKAQTVQNTRKIHQAVNLQTGNTLKVRSLSCFCTKCEAGDPDCLNSNYVDSYREITLKEQTKSNKSSADESKNFTSEKPKASKTRQKTESPKRGETEQSEETPEINKMGGSKTTKAENERHQYFSSLIAIMEQAGTEGFEKLKEVSLALQTEINEMYPSEIVNCQFSFADRKYKADQIALTLFPEDIRNGGLLPVNVTADGNCLPRTGSILSFGNESAHEEMRVRIAIELCLNLDLYIDNNYLNRGENFPEQESKSLDKTYTMFSEQYVPGTKITKRVTEKIFKEETVKICKTAEYMGIWQLFALSSVLQKKISSVYPNLGQSSVRQLLNRNILPRQGDHMEQGVTVMWTSTRTDMEPQNWIPNHFVPLLPVTRLPYLPEMLGDLSGMVDDIEFNEEDTEISLDDHMMDTIFDILSVTDDIYPTPTPDGAPMPGGTEPTANPNPTPEGIKTTPDGTPTPEHTESSTGTDDVNPTPIPDGPPMPGGTEPTANPNPTTEGIKTTPDGTSTPEHTESSTGTDDVNATPTPDGPPMPGGTEPIANCTPTHEGIKTTPDGTPTPEYTESRFRTGDYVLVEHGKCLYPAVMKMERNVKRKRDSSPGPSTESPSKRYMYRREESAEETKPVIVKKEEKEGGEEIVPPNTSIHLPTRLVKDEQAGRRRSWHGRNSNEPAPSTSAPTAPPARAPTAPRASAPRAPTATVSAAPRRRRMTADREIAAQRHVLVETYRPGGNRSSLRVRRQPVRYQA